MYSVTKNALQRPAHSLFTNYLKKLEHISFKQLETLKFKLVYCDCMFIERTNGKGRYSYETETLLDVTGYKHNRQWTLQLQNIAAN